jgi:hypothetical protein
MVTEFVAKNHYAYEGVDFEFDVSDFEKNVDSKFDGLDQK